MTRLLPVRIVRPIVWFAAASMITTVLHELTHAVVAYLLGVRSTLFSYFAHLDPTPAQAASPRISLIRIAGPLFCLGLGAIAWMAYRRTRDSDLRLPLLYFTIFGIGTFFGNLMSIALVGDFSSVAVALGLPMGIRISIAAIGALLVAAIHFWGGRELVQWAPAGVGRMGSMLGSVALPALLGTAIVIIVNQPMPPAFTAARLGEAAFWLFAAAGALATGGPALRSRPPVGVRWADAAALILAILVVRLMASGIALTP